MISIFSITWTIFSHFLVTKYHFSSLKLDKWFHIFPATYHHEFTSIKGHNILTFRPRFERAKLTSKWEQVSINKATLINYLVQHYCLIPSLNAQSCITGLLVVLDFWFWAVWAAAPVLKKMGRLWANFEGDFSCL